VSGTRGRGRVWEGNGRGIGYGPIAGLIVDRLLRSGLLEKEIDW
jgi:hypothetical protein